MLACSSSSCAGTDGCSPAGRHAVPPATHAQAGSPPLPSPPRPPAPPQGSPVQPAHLSLPAVVSLGHLQEPLLLGRLVGAPGDLVGGAVEGRPEVTSHTMKTNKTNKNRKNLLMS